MKRLNVMLLAVLLAVGCGKKPQNTAYNPVIDVEAIVMGLTDGTHHRTYIGHVASDMEVDLGFPMGGKLTKIYVHNGQRVKKGDVLACVDETSARSMHDISLATLKQAEDGYNRMKQVYDQGGVSEVRWMQMVTDLEKARQSEIASGKRLDDCTLRAPADGIISMEPHIVGEDLSPMESLCKLLDLRSLHIEFSVPEQDIHLVNRGERTTATMPSFPDKELKVSISDKGLIANPMGHTYTVKAHITDNDGVEMLPGLVAKVRLNSTADDGLTVPSWCIQTMEKGLVVWVVRNGKAFRAPIQVKSYVRNGVLVEKGIEPGDTVITDGYSKLYKGAPVNVAVQE